MSNPQNPTARIETNLGAFEFELHIDKVPGTAKNFIDLTEKGFYDGLIFHRVVPGFVAQGGDPDGNGMGGPGYSIDLEIHPDLRHNAAGSVAMARSQDPNSAGSQWYVTLAPAEFLNDQYAVFGTVTKGLDVIKAIGQAELKPNTEQPANNVVMEKVSIIHP